MVDEQELQVAYHCMTNIISMQWPFYPQHKAYRVTLDISPAYRKIANKLGTIVIGAYHTRIYILINGTKSY